MSRAFKVLNCAILASIASSVARKWLSGITVLLDSFPISQTFIKILCEFLDESKDFFAGALHTKGCEGQSSFISIMLDFSGKGLEQGVCPPLPYLIK